MVLVADSDTYNSKKSLTLKKLLSRLMALSLKEKSSRSSSMLNEQKKMLRKIQNLLIKVTMYSFKVLPKVPLKLNSMPYFKSLEKFPRAWFRRMTLMTPYQTLALFASKRPSQLASQLRSWTNKRVLTEVTFSFSIMLLSVRMILLKTRQRQRSLKTSTKISNQTCSWTIFLPTLLRLKSLTSLHHSVI